MFCVLTQTPHLSQIISRENHNILSGKCRLSMQLGTCLSGLQILHAVTCRCVPAGFICGCLSLLACRSYMSLPVFACLKISPGVTCLCLPAGFACSYLYFLGCRFYMQLPLEEAHEYHVNDDTSSQSVLTKTFNVSSAEGGTYSVHPHSCY